MNYWKQGKENIYVAAHRGLSSDYPENTMIAFEKAIEAKVDQIEVDIRVTKDNELVLIHDNTVDRTTNGTGRVCDFTLEELKKLDAGSWKDEKFSDCTIPTLIEFMELIKDLPEMTVDFELKEYPVEGWEDVAFDVCDRVLAIIDEYGYTDRCIINTFSGKLHEYINDKYGSKYRQHMYYPLKNLGEVTRDPYEYGYCVCMFSNPETCKTGSHNIATKEEFDQMKEKYNIQPWAGAFVKDAETVDVAIERGSVLITCNNADVVLELLKQRGKHN